MEIFARTNRKVLEKPVFVSTKIEAAIKNPDFIRLHAVRVNEIGWGFDADGCLALCLVFRDGAQLKSYDIFVERIEIKRESEE